MAEYDVNEVWSLVERVAKAGSDTATNAEREAFGWLQSTLGLKRSPEQYAKRTRSRYRSAAKRGETAKQANSREYRQRKAKKPAKSKTSQTSAVNTIHRQWIHLLDRIDIRNSYFNQSYEIDEDDLKNAILCFGYDTVLERVNQEIVSLKAYTQQRNIEPGHGYWYGNRTMQPVGTIRMPPEKSPFADEWGELPEIGGAQIYFGNDFYFYHGTMSRR
jgi:hypothetical protein